MQKTSEIDQFIEEKSEKKRIFFCDEQPIQTIAFKFENLKRLAKL